MVAPSATLARVGTESHCRGIRYITSSGSCRAAHSSVVRGNWQPGDFPTSDLPNARNVCCKNTEKATRAFSVRDILTYMTSIFGCVYACDI